jgi:hypothetical protein
VILTKFSNFVFSTARDTDKASKLAEKVNLFDLHRDSLRNFSVKRAENTRARRLPKPDDSLIESAPTDNLAAKSMPEASICVWARPFPLVYARTFAKLTKNL